MKGAKQGKKVQTWVGIAISFASLAAIFYFIDPQQVLLTLRTADYGYLLLSLLGIIAFLIIRAVRWRFMLNNRVSLSDVFHIQNIGYLLTNVLPLRIGEVARAVLIGNVPPVTVAQGISTMVVERILDMLFIITLLPFTLAEVGALPPAMREGVRLVGFLAVAGIVVLIAAANQRPLARRLATFLFDKISFLDTRTWVRRSDDLLLGLNSLTRLRDGMILIGLSIVVWIPIIFAYYMGMRAVQLEPTLVMVAFVICAAALTIAAPSSPGQVGVYHAGVTFALATILKQPEAQAAGFAILYHALNFVTMVIAGLIGMRYASSTFSNVVATTRSFMNRRQSPIEIGE